tara:strand:- start:263 stop:442 length:180 start_codon:yes stop_codon:yes gene_type:complete
MRTIQLSLKEKLIMLCLITMISLAISLSDWVLRGMLPSLKIPLSALNAGTGSLWWALMY